MKASLAFALFILSNSPAWGDADMSHTATVVDYGTTAVGILEFGATEANPLALPMMPVRLYLTEKHRGTCHDWLTYHTAGGWGAGGWNILMLAGAGPAAAVGLLAAIPAYRYARDRQLDCKAAVLHKVLQEDRE